MTVRRALFVASSGGHLDELYQLRPSLVDDSTAVTWVTFDCAHSRSLLAAERDVVYIADVGPRAYAALLFSILPALRILISRRPTAVFSTGAAIALAFLPLAFVVGARATYVESAARISGPSRTGRLLALVPWLRLRTQYRSWAGPRWQYDGSVFDGLLPYSLGTFRRPVRRVVVTLGTQLHYPFVDLVERVKAIVPDGVEVRWQVGGDYPEAGRPAGAHGLVPADELRGWITSADAVIAHAGVGSALTILCAGHRPVLVARRAEFGEHVDDHQAQLVDELSERGLAVAATPLDLTWDHVLESARSVVGPAQSTLVAPAARAAGHVAAHAVARRAVPAQPVRPAHAARPTRVPRRVARRSAVAALIVTALIGSGVDSADAVGLPAAQSVTDSATPSALTPNILSATGYVATVYAITQVGNLVVVGGAFGAVQNHGSTTTLTRTDVLAFDATSGAVSTTFAPTLDGAVQAVYPGPVANTVYLGGFFTTVNGTKSKGLTLVSTTTGAIVAGFKPPVLDGSVYSIAAIAGHVLVTGSFTKAGASTRQGTMSLNPTTGALDTFLQVALLGHHNYDGTSATTSGAVGGRAMAVNPSGTRLVLVGDFKTAAGLARDQLVMIDLDGTSAAVDRGWATSKYTAACSSKHFDNYVRDVQFSPDGSYFVIAATGGGTTTLNTDGSRSLCDSAARWDTATSSLAAVPTWVDYTGNDSLWSVAISGTAVYVGGHQRWLNNDTGQDTASAGAMPRPGLAALDPVSGVPLAWNPGRNPRGAGAYALFIGTGGLYVGSDTDYVGDFHYKHQKLVYFPLAGGVAPASTAVADLPANVYSAGALAPEAGTSAADLSWRPVSGTRTATSTAVASTGINWSTTRGAFMVGSTIFYGATDGNFYRASFTGTTVGAPIAVDPYNDPAWASVQTGSGQTYRGMRPTYYGEISALTGAFYLAGRLFYTLSGHAQLFWRWFSPDSGGIGSTEYSTSGLDLSRVAGMFVSGTGVYWVGSTDGALHRATLVGTTVDPTSDSIVGGPAIDGHDWRAHGLFPFGQPVFPNVPPAASATATCTGLDCSFDGTSSSDCDGTVASYSWNFGDGATVSGATARHGYARAGTYPVSLTVTDNRGGTNTWTTQVTATDPSVPVSFVGSAGVNGGGAAPAVGVPSAVLAGDTELLYVTTANDGVTGTPSGWQPLTVLTNSPLETTVFSRTADSNDAGSTVSVPLSAATQTDVQLLAYRGVSAVAAATAGDTNTTVHDAPAVLPTAGGSYVVTYWSSRTSGTSVWGYPAAITLRGQGAGTVGGHVDAIVGDSGPLPTTVQPVQEATSDAASAKGDSVRVVLSPTP